MAILGVESVIFGVDDLDRCAIFWEDFGLNPVSRTTDELVFDVQSGARIVVRKRGDRRLPTAYSHKVGAHETVWGVDTQTNLDKLVANLRTDREVTIDTDGVAHFSSDCGMPLGLAVWTPRKIVSQPDPVNAPGNIQRLNLHRKWRQRAIPKTINHVVFFVKDYVGTFEFFRDRLNFRLTDHSRGVGAFARCDGAWEHHNIFFVSCALPVAPDEPGFMHMAFGLEDIDELMIGVNIMEKKGWKNDSPNTMGGLSRHRISSAIYYYFDSPAGGEAEYHVDTDYLDDNWIPRSWDFKFGSLIWATRIPSMWAGDVPMDMTFDPDGKSLEAYRLKKPAAATKADEPIKA
jgi:catechol 2,3-dioxygenase-like lactoylglutathione lyase family enzyme